MNHVNHVVVIGGGFGGLSAVRAMRDMEVGVPVFQIQPWRKTAFHERKRV